MGARKVKRQRHTYQDMYALLYPSDEMAVKNVTFVVTEQCNLRCTYCYEVHKKSKSMTKEVGIRAIDMLFEEYAKGGEYINDTNSHGLILDFIGGEPLLEIDLIDDIVEYFKYKAISLKHPWALHYMISMTSNGILYNTPKVQEFIARNAGRISMTITIDGSKELHDACRIFPDGRGSYDIVEKAIKHQIANNDHVSTKLTLAPGNVAYLCDAIKNLESLGLDEISANCVYEEGWEVSHAKTLYSQMKQLADYLLEGDRVSKLMTTLFADYVGQPMDEKRNLNWCGGTGAMLAVAPNGDLYPCIRYLPFTLQNDRPAMIIGNIWDGIETKENEKKCVGCLKCITRKSQSTDECFNCPIADGCAWCSGLNYDIFGTPDKRATYSCVMHKARVMANAYFWNSYYRADNLQQRFNLTIPEEWALEIIDEKEFEMLKKLASWD